MRQLYKGKEESKSQRQWYTHRQKGNSPRNYQEVWHQFMGVILHVDLNQDVISYRWMPHCHTCSYSCCVHAANFILFICQHIYPQERNNSKRKKDLFDVYLYFMTVTQICQLISHDMSVTNEQTLVCIGKETSTPFYLTEVYVCTLSTIVILLDLQLFLYSLQPLFFFKIY